MLRKIFIIAFVGCIVAALSFANGQKEGTGGQAKGAAGSKTLVLSDYGTPGSTLSKAVEEFKQLVESGTNGRIKLQIHQNNQLGDAPTQLDLVRGGSVDIVIVGNPYYTSFDPEMELTDIPYLFVTREQVHKVLDGQVGTQLLDSLSKYNLKGLGFFELGFRDMTNNVRPIRQPADLRGLKIRTTPNPLHIAAFKIWGANPTPMPFTQVYMALKTGAVDGQENPAYYIYENHLYEVQKYLSLDRHAYTTAPMVMNLKTWKSLSRDDQQVIQKAALTAVQHQRSLNAALNNVDIQKMKEYGVKVVEHPDIQAFKKALGDTVLKMYTSKFGSKLLDEAKAEENQ